MNGTKAFHQMAFSMDKLGLKDMANVSNVTGDELCSPHMPPSNFRLALVEVAAWHAA
jgi:hypothetical protein